MPLPRASEADVETYPDQTHGLGHKVSHEFTVHHRELHRTGE
jgi:hypothetical protein